MLVVGVGCWMRQKAICRVLRRNQYCFYGERCKSLHYFSQSFGGQKDTDTSRVTNRTKPWPSPGHRDIATALLVCSRRKFAAKIICGRYKQSRVCVLVSTSRVPSVCWSWRSVGRAWPLHAVSSLNLNTIITDGYTLGKGNTINFIPARKQLGV